MRVRLLAPAVIELEDAARYYDAKRNGLSDSLYGEVEAALDFIAAFPEASPTTALGARRYNLKGFPYYLIYRVRHDEIVVGVTGHAHRDPTYWHHRDFG